MSLRERLETTRKPREVRKEVAALTNRKWWRFWRSDVSPHEVESVARSALDARTRQHMLREDEERGEKLLFDLKHVLESLIREKLPEVVGTVRSRTATVKKEYIDRLMERHELESGDLDRNGLQEMEDVAALALDATQGATRGSTEGGSDSATRFGLKVMKCTAVSFGEFQIEAMEEYCPGMPLWQVSVEQLVAKKTSLKSVGAEIENSMVPEISSIGYFQLCSSLSVKAAWLQKGNLVMAVQKKGEARSEILVWKISSWHQGRVLRRSATTSRSPCERGRRS